MPRAGAAASASARKTSARVAISASTYAVYHAFNLYIAYVAAAQRMSCVRRQLLALTSHRQRERETPTAGSQSSKRQRHIEQRR